MLHVVLARHQIRVAGSTVIENRRSQRDFENSSKSPLDTGCCSYYLSEAMKRELRKVIALRLTATERAAIERAAKRDRLPISVWMRSRLLLVAAAPPRN